MAALCWPGINKIYVEAGAAPNGVLLEFGLVDGWIAYIAPMAAGHDARELFNQTPLESREYAARICA